MIWIANSLVALVAVLHVYFLVLERFSDSPAGPSEHLQNQKIDVQHCGRAPPNYWRSNHPAVPPNPHTSTLQMTGRLRRGLRKASSWRAGGSATLLIAACPRRRVDLRPSRSVT